MGLTAGAAQQSGSGCRELLSLGAATINQFEMILRRLNAYLAKELAQFTAQGRCAFGDVSLRARPAFSAIIAEDSSQASVYHAGEPFCVLRV